MLNVNQVREVYRRIAPRYDRAVTLFPVFGVRLGRYRREARKAFQFALSARTCAAFVPAPIHASIAPV